MRLPDPRTQGSNNPGATNVLRIGGKLPAAITLLGDVLKGLIPVLFAKWLAFSPLFIALTAVFAFLGHLYPVFFRFQGGKGVATLIGCLIALSLPVVFCFLAIWLAIAITTRYSSLASLTATLLLPLYTWYFTNPEFTAATAFMAILLFYRHRTNIQKLLAGKENKI